MRYLLIAFALFLSSCTRQGAVDYTLSPAMVMSSKGIVKDAGTSEDSTLFANAVAAKDYETARVLWPVVKASALDSIESRETSGAIGPNVAESLRERLRVFETALEKTQ